MAKINLANVARITRQPRRLGEVTRIMLDRYSPGSTGLTPAMLESYRRWKAETDTPEGRATQARLQRMEEIEAIEIQRRLARMEEIERIISADETNERLSRYDTVRRIVRADECLTAN